MLTLNIQFVSSIHLIDPNLNAFIGNKFADPKINHGVTLNPVNSIVNANLSSSNTYLIKSSVTIFSIFFKWMLLNYHIVYTHLLMLSSLLLVDDAPVFDCNMI